MDVFNQLTSLNYQPFVLLILGYFLYNFIYYNFIVFRLPKSSSRELPPAREAWWFPIIGHLIFTMNTSTIEADDISVDEFNSLYAKVKDEPDFDATSHPDFVGATFQVLNLKMAVLHHPEDIKHITQTNFNNYCIGDLRRMSVKHFLGKGIFTTDGEFWKTQRNLAKPSFQTVKLEGMVEIFTRHSEELVEILKKRTENGQSVDVQKLFLCFTLDSSGEVLFQHSIGSLQGDIPFQRAFDYLQYATEQILTNPLLMFVPNSKYSAAVKTCNEFVEKIIHAAKEDPNLNTREDLLAHFMTSLDENGNTVLLDDKYLRDMLMNFLIAGRDTTAVSLTWLFYELSLHPEIQERLYEELTLLFPDSNPSTIDELRSLKYLKDTINETLRLHPPVPRVLRCSINDDVLPSGYQMKGGTNIIYETYFLHRSSRIWGEDVLVFDPDRWGDERTTSIGAYEFLPFHGGPRRCLGFDLAYNEIKVCAAHLIRNFKFSLDKSVKVRHLGAITLAAQNGVHLFLTPRNS